MSAADRDWEQLRARALKLARDNDDLTGAAIASRLDVSTSRVTEWLRVAGLARPRGGTR